MFNNIRKLLAESSPGLRRRLVSIYAVLAVLNIGSWIWAFVAFHDNPGLLGVALVVYGLGLRHAVDADHIAAIDNVTRKLMQDGQRPVSVGFFFAMGHSFIVILGVVVVTALSGAVGNWQGMHDIGSTVSTIFSVFFLFAIAAMNLAILWGIYQSYRQLRLGKSYAEEDLDLLLNKRGFVARIFRPIFKLVTKSWHMFPVGFLFGLGFDTASEIAAFGLAASQAAKGLPIGTVLVLPVLFGAGMSLVDTTDGVMMLGAYNWAFLDPARKLFYNMTITLVSIVVAVLIGGIEALGVIADQLSLKGTFWEAVGTLNDNFGVVGFIIVAVFAVAWVVSYLFYRAKALEHMPS